MQHKYVYDKQKNLKLQLERNINFEDIIEAIHMDKVLDIIPHPNKKRYPNQKIMVIEIRQYIYLVPYVEDEDMFVLKTIFPSRKFTKKYLTGDEHEAH